MPPMADDWFDEPRIPAAPRRRPTGRSDVITASRVGNPRILAGALAAALLLLGLGLGLAVSGVFRSGTVRRAATTAPAPPAKAKTTTAVTPRPQARGSGPSIPLKPGDQGPQVTVLQRTLVSVGYSPGAVVGHYGPSTQRAVAQFQRAFHLAPDGIVGPRTLLLLSAQLGGP
ncbi:MAG: g-D-glutamyl-meso-diaminopimelate peptidase [Gaiellaceae bacterium]|nr:g-D-glutamyl-meso-diaminopimelate peptidase [Gaiellaceae bacterium]